MVMKVRKSKMAMEKISVVEKVKEREEDEL